MSITTTLTVRDLIRILSAYRQDSPIVVSPDHYNHWTFQVIDRKTRLVIVPVDIYGKEEK
jgi:hypothetical protein